MHPAVICVKDRNVRLPPPVSRHSIPHAACQSAMCRREALTCLFLLQVVWDGDPGNLIRVLCAGEPLSLPLHLAGGVGRRPGQPRGGAWDPRRSR